MGQGVQTPQRQVGQLAGLQRADLVGSAQNPGAADGGDLQGVPDGHRLRAAGGPGEQQRVADLLDQTAGLVARGAVDPEPDGRTGRAKVDGPGDASTEPGVGGRTVGDAGADRAEASHLVVVEVDAVCEPHVRSQPPQTLDVVQRRAAEVLPAEGILIGGLSQVGVQAHTCRTGQLGGLPHQVTGHRERGARRDSNAQHRVRGGVVPAADRRLSRSQDRVTVLHDIVRWQATRAATQVHGAASRMEP